MHSFTRYKSSTSTAHLVEKNNLLKLSNYHAQSKRWGNLTRRKSDENWAKTREKRRSRTAREVVAVETDRVTVPLRPIAGYYFRTAVARPHGEQLTSLSRPTTKAARYYLFSLAKVLWSERYEEGMENGTGRRRNRLVDANVPYFFHPPTILRRI